MIVVQVRVDHQIDVVGRQAEPRQPADQPALRSLQWQIAALLLGQLVAVARVDEDILAVACTSRLCCVIGSRLSSVGGMNSVAPERARHETERAARVDASTRQSLIRCSLKVAKLDHG